MIRVRERAPDQGPDQGLTLLELVVVLAVFALLATLSLQALTGTLRTRDRLVELDRDTADITLALSRLRNDLDAAAPLVFHAPGDRIHSAFDIPPGGQGFALSRSGWLDLPGETTAGFGRVIWHYDAAAGTLSRAAWPVLIPADPRARSPDVVVATGITGFEIRTMTPNGLWVSGLDPALSGPASSLPRAVDVILTSARFGRISTLVSYP